MSDAKIKPLLAILPVLSAGLYLMGATYHEGNLAEFGIEPSLFPLAFDRMLFLGVISLVSFGLQPVIYAVCAALGLIAAVLLTAVMSSAPRVRRLQQLARLRLLGWLQKAQQGIQPTPEALALINKGEVIYGYVVGTFAVVLALVFAAAFSSKTGREHAALDISRFAAKSHASQEVHLVGNEPFRAMQIACGPTFCAFWRGRDALLVRHDQISRIVAYPAPKKPS